MNEPLNFVQRFIKKKKNQMKQMYFDKQTNKKFLWLFILKIQVLRLRWLIKFVQFTSKHESPTFI